MTSSTSSTSTATERVAAEPGNVVCPIDTTYPQAWPDRPRYRADLDVDPAGRRVNGTMSVEFTPDASTDRLVFRLWANAPRQTDAGTAAAVRDVRVDGVEVVPVLQAANGGAAGTLMELPLAAPLEAGHRVTVSMALTLRAGGVTNDRVATVANAVRLGSILPTLSWIRGVGWQTAPATRAFAEAAASEVADYDVGVSTRAGWTVLATGVETGAGRWQASAVRDWAATVAKMKTAEVTAQGGTTRVIAGVAAGSGIDPATIAKQTARALDEFAARFGPYPYPQLTVGVSPSLSGGIEFPMHIMFGATAKPSSLVHEVAHQWFYGIVGNDQARDPWLDEGLAEYAEASARGEVAARRKLAIPAAGRGHLGEPMTYWESRRNAYFRSVYVQGLEALAVVSDKLGGPDRLDCALRRYVHDRAYAVARPSDLLGAIDATAGQPIAAALLSPFGVRA